MNAENRAVTLKASRLKLLPQVLLMSFDWPRIEHAWGIEVTGGIADCQTDQCHETWESRAVACWES